MSEDDLYIEIDKYRSLLERYFEGKLSNEERKMLAQWLWAERTNRDLLQKLRSEQFLKKYYEQASKIDEVYEFKLLSQRYPRVNLHRKKRTTLRNYYVAATIACLLAIGGWLLFSQPEVPQAILIHEASQVQAILTTSEGEVIILEKGQRQIQVNNIGSFELRDSIKELVCKEESDKTISAGFHKLEIPKGGEYNLVLSDGTFVSLNSESSIRFPEKFDGLYREIEITGEVYFKVAKDAEHPFIVHAGDYCTEVLGTRFGMRVFPDEGEWSTVLEEGKVKVSYHTQQVVLLPGEKVYLNYQKLESCSADIEKELAWVNGLFVFKHDRLEQVVRELSRWYNVEFVFGEESLKDYLFTGNVCRDLGIDEILSLVERMNIVKFKKNKNNIIVEKNDKAEKYN